MSGFPGANYRQNNLQPGYGPPQPAYGAPPPQGYPQPGYGPGPAYNGGGPGYNYGAPTYGGPPPHPPRQDYAYQGGGPRNHNGGGWAPPTGPPIPPRYESGSGGHNPQFHMNDRPQQPGPPAPPAHRPPVGSQYYGPQMQGGGGGQPQQPYFEYSQCTGKKKALCIGINYIGTSQALAGCINDAHNMSKFLCDKFGYKQDDIVMLTDDARNPRQIPTRANMIAAMHWLVADARPNDSLFFHYSGHGGQTKDLDGDEEDGYDETVYPLDHQQAGHIVDDEMHDIMVKRLPPGCRLTAIFDSCHSATALDLPYVYSTEGKIKEPNLLADAGQGLLSAGTSYLRGDIGGMVSGVFSLGKKMVNSSSGSAKQAKQSKTSAADVVSWSGCKDDQTSADTAIASQATGAMSYAFIASLHQNPQQSYMQLLNNIRGILKVKYSQKPQLSASHPMDCNLLFIC